MGLGKLNKPMVNDHEYFWFFGVGCSLTREVTPPSPPKTVEWGISGL